MTENRELRTQFAMKALDMSEVFEVTFGDQRLPGDTKRQPVLSVPEGQSTAGGAQAVQSISLVPEDHSAGTLVAGTVNGASMGVELRGYPYLNATHQMRYHGKTVDIPAGSYQQFLDGAKRFFTNHGYKVTVVNQLPESAKRHYAQAAKPNSGGGAFWLLLVLLVLAGAGAAAYLLFFK